MNGPELCAFAGITYRQADFWTRQGLLRPYGRAAATQGYPRDYPDGEARVARRMARLIEAGLRLRPAHDIARGDEKGARVLRQALEAS